MLKPLIGTVGQWRKIFKGLEFMGDDLNKKWKFIPRPDLDTGKPMWRKIFDYYRTKWWLRFPPKEPKWTFTKY